MPEMTIISCVVKFVDNCNLPSLRETGKEELLVPMVEMLMSLLSGQLKNKRIKDICFILHYL